MILQEKIGQMTQIDCHVATPSAIRDLSIGLSLSTSREDRPDDTMFFLSEYWCCREYMICTSRRTSSSLTSFEVAIDGRWRWEEEVEVGCGGGNCDWWRPGGYLSPPFLKKKMYFFPFFSRILEFKKKNPDRIQISELTDSDYYYRIHKDRIRVVSDSDQIQIQSDSLTSLVWSYVLAKHKILRRSWDWDFELKLGGSSDGVTAAVEENIRAQSVHLENLY